ncbi:MAG: hypothetical protein U5R06_23975 [candidate division KSB1 bacterium]|nr:hypothetical protein [candidate division KSB1 bacterium]
MKKNGPLHADEAEEQGQEQPVENDTERQEEPENEKDSNYLEQLQRLQAEFLNYKKRTEQRMTGIKKI